MYDYEIYFHYKILLKKLKIKYKLIFHINVGMI